MTSFFRLPSNPDKLRKSVTIPGFIPIVESTQGDHPHPELDSSSKPARLPVVLDDESPAYQEMKRIL